MAAARFPDNVDCLLSKAYLEFSTSHGQLERTLGLVSANSAASMDFIRSVHSLTKYLNQYSEINDCEVLRNLLSNTLINGRAALRATKQISKELGISIDDIGKTDDDVPIVIAPSGMLWSYVLLIAIRQDLKATLGESKSNLEAFSSLHSRLESMVRESNKNLCVAIEALINSQQVSQQTKIFVDLLEEIGLFK